MWRFARAERTDCTTMRIPQAAIAGVWFEGTERGLHPLTYFAYGPNEDPGRTKWEPRVRLPQPSVSDVGEPVGRSLSQTTLPHIPLAVLPREGGGAISVPRPASLPHVTAQLAGVNAENVNRYVCCVASYSAWNLVGCGPASPGTSGIGKSNDCFRISIALESIGSMKIGFPL